MKYTLCAYDGSIEDLLVWVCRYLRYKATTLSNRLVHNREVFQNELENLSSFVRDRNALQKSVKNLRNAGLIGINTYSKPLLTLLEHMEKKPNFHFTDIDDEMLNDFLAVHTSQLSIQSRRNYRMAILNFFKYIDENQKQENGYIFGIKLDVSQLKNARAKLPAYLKEEEVEKFLNALETFPFSEKVKDRDILIVLLILHTGARVSEILLLEKKHFIIDGDLCVLHIVGKGGKSRNVAILKNAIQDHLRKWLILRETFEYIHNDLLFCNQRGKALSQAYIYRNVENVLRYAGINKPKMGAHLLRHSFATLLYQKHKDLLLVQESLGHADLNTSRIYTHFDKDQLKHVASLIPNVKKPRNTH